MNIQRLQWVLEEWIPVKITSSLDRFMLILGIICGVSVFCGATSWLFLYVKGPNQPYIGGSVFTMAQVVTIFGGFSFAASFSELVDAGVRSVLRYVGGLHLISALGFTLLGMSFPLATVDSV